MSVRKSEVHRPDGRCPRLRRSAVYVQSWEPKCARVGRDSNVPLGFVILTEDLITVGMGLWKVAQMLYRGELGRVIVWLTVPQRRFRAG